MVILTARALAESLQLRSDQPQWQALDLRLYLDGKGCDGFYYGVAFDQRDPKDLVFSQTPELDLIVDPDTFEFVEGAVIDWVDDERGRGFLVENPKHKLFRGKFYKKKTWQDRLDIKKTQSALIKDGVHES